MNRMETDAASIVDRTNHAAMLDRAIVPAARHRVLIAVLAVLLYRRMGMITPLIVAHGMYDVSAAMTNLTGIAGSSWSLIVGLAIMAMPVVWAIVRCAR
ncbi:hypothetical protein APC1461_0966 [Bifidobacterium longum]|uniref:Uncharacterized protein n=1 Tax=Bifidobacterium longum TaxID=216816 RepID=A0A2N0TK20_BIFLN|nr:hypothetical protein [Bifidobacterium longum]PKD15094.1 hypothetical protein APC1461_0966 [Bifidobacterium longum]